MAFGGINAVTAVLLADTKEYSAKMDEAAAKMEALGGVADTTGGKFTNFANKASTLIIGAGLAIGAVGVDLAIKFQTALDQVQNTTNATAATIDKISKSATNLSNVTTSSATEIVQAYGAVEAAGYGWAKAEDTVTAAAKLAQITQQSVLTVSQALVATQALGLSRGMSAAKVADILTIALKGNEQGLTGVTSLLQGKVGAAFAGYHQSLGEALVVANEFSQGQFTNSRAISAVIQKIGALQGPLKTTTDTNGELSVSTASWVDALNNVGLNALKTRAAFAGPDGLINGLQYLKTTADGSLPKLEQYLTAIGGSAGVGPLTLLINHLGQAKTLIDQTGKASGQGLNTAFNLSQKDIDNQMEELKNKAENVLRGVGMFLLPDVKDLANWTDDTFKYFQAHPLVSKIASDSAIGLFGAAVAYKIGKGLVSAVQGIKSLFGGSALTLNTTATQENTDALLGKTGATGVGDAELAGGGALATFGKSVLVFGAGVVAFEGASKFLETKEGKKIGNSVLNANFLGLDTISNITADVLHKRVYGSSLADKPEEKYLKSIGEWGNYLKLIQADDAANYTEVAKLSAAISKRENKGKGKVTINVGFNKGR